MGAEHFRTGRDIFDAVMQTARQAPSLSDQYATDAKMAIMQEYLAILSHAQFFFAKHPTPAVLSTVARDRVTVTSIAGSTVNLSAPLTPSRVGRKFYLDATQTYYRISAHADNTAVLTLDAPYLEPQTSGAGTIYQDEYPLLTTVLMPWTPMRIRGQWERDLNYKVEAEFQARYGWSTTSAISVPEAYTLVRTDADQRKVIQLAPWPESAINIEYQYTYVPATLTFDHVAATDTPIIPLEYRWVLYQRALSQLFASKDDNLSERAWKRAEHGLAQMVEQYTVNDQQNRVWVRPRFGLGVG